MKVYDASGKLLVSSSVAILDDIGDVDVSSPADDDVIYWDDGESKWKAKAPATGTVDISGTPVANDIARFTDVDTIEGRSYAELKADLDLEVGVDLQAYDVELAAIAGLTSATNKLPYFTGSGTASLADLTAFARSILDDADEATFKATVNLEIGTDVLAEQTIGIADDNLVEVDGPTTGAPASGEYARWTANGIEGRQKSEVLIDLNVADGADVTGSNAPQAHASTHDSGGSDQVHSIADDDDDTKVQVEESVDEDMVRMDVAGVEAFLLDDIGVLTLAKQSRIHVYRNTNQTITTGTWTKIQFNTETYDNQHEFDPTTNYRFTATVAGYYSVALTGIVIAMAADKRAGVALKKNGAFIALNLGHTSHVADAGTFLAAILSLAATDYIEGFVYHDAGSDRSLSGGDPSHTFMMIHKLS